MATANPTRVETTVANASGDGGDVAVAKGEETRPNTFGSPVTDETVRRALPCTKKVTREERAYVAYKMRDKGTKHEDAVKHAMKEWCKGCECDTVPATFGTIYNATGDALLLYKSHNFEGQISGEPYPDKIENGQWASFLHMGKCGSSGAVIYRRYCCHEEDGDREQTAWLLAWTNTEQTPEPTECGCPCVLKTRLVYAEIRNCCQYEGEEFWNFVEHSIHHEHMDTTARGCLSSVSMTQEYPCVFKGIMTLEGFPDSPLHIEDYLY